MKKYLAKLYILISFALVFSLISCNNIFQQIKTDDTKTENSIKDTPPSQDNDLAYISLGGLVVGKQLARYSVPLPSNETLLSKLTNVNLECARTGDGTPVNISGDNWADFLSKFTSPGQTYPLQTGSYNFTLTATLQQLPSGSGVAFSASKTNINISSGTTETLSFTLAPTTQTTGGIQITWNISQGAANLDLVEFSLKKLPSGTPSTSSDDDVSSGSAKFGTSVLEPGEYELTADFRAAEDDYDDPELPPLNTWKGNVRVAAGITTTATIDWALETVYTITWNMDGGTIADATYVQPERYTRKSDTISLPTLTKTGYDFDGWYTNASFTGDEITSIPKNSTGNKTLYAKWTLHEYNITYHYTGATLSGDFPETYTITESAVIPGSATAAKTGWIFVGWFLDEDATGSPITTISQTTVGSLDDVDLYAYFSNSIFVSSDGDSENDGLRPATAVDTVATAVSKIVSLNKGSNFDWNIAVCGTVTGIQTISNSSLTSSVAKSVTLTGEDSDSVLNGGNLSSGDTRTTLTINTTFPITITNLKITGGCGTKYTDNLYYGGGLYLDANSVVKLGDGVMITGNACDHGGGVFVESGAKLFMYDESYVGDPDKTAASQANLFTGREYDSAQYANSAWSSEAGVGYGGGILNYGSVYLGYSEYTSETDNTPQELTGGVYGNAAFVGGGIYNGKGDSVTGSLLVMNSGNITQNVANQYYDNQLNFQNAYGGGVYNYSTFILTENTLSDDQPTLSDNKAKNGGGAVYNSKIDTTTLCVFTMNDGLISGNTSPNSTGGGVYNNGIVTMSNGSFDSNIANSDGAAISNYGEFVTGNTGEGNAVFTMTGGSITNCKATSTTKGMSSISFNTYSTVTLNGSVSVYYEPNSDGQNSGYISCTSTLIIGENFWMSKDPYTLALKYANTTVSEGTPMIIDYANNDWCTDTLLLNEGYHLNGSGEIVAD